MALCTFTPIVNSKRNAELLKFKRDIGSRIKNTHRGCASTKPLTPREKDTIIQSSSSFKYDKSDSLIPN
jgi:hypothetical protein